MNPRFTRSVTRLTAIGLGLAWAGPAHAAQLSLRFAGGGNEVSLDYGETAVVEAVWTSQATDTTKSGVKLTGLSLRFNVDDDSGQPLGGLQVNEVDCLPGWELFNSNGVPFTEADFFLDAYDPSGNGIAGNGTVFETVVASFIVRNDTVLTDDAFVTFRHASPGDPLPSAEDGAGIWTFLWQEGVVAAGQYDSGQGNPGDADAVWDPYHGYETLQPLTIHMTGGSYVEPGPCQLPKTWRTVEEFAEGTRVNVADATVDGGIYVNNAIPGGGPQPLPAPLPYLWVAVSGRSISNSWYRGTIVRIHTETGAVLGEYLSAPGPYNPGPEGHRDPSRTTVDLYGNCIAGNRAEEGFVGEVRMGSVVKIGLVIGGTPVTVDNKTYLEPPFDYCTCVDRDNDGRIRTSSGLENVLAWPDNEGDGESGPCGPATVQAAEDECILVYQRTSSHQVRHVSIDRNNDAWVSGYDQIFDLMDGDTGRVFQSIPMGNGGYGGLVDGNGILWSATRSGLVLRYDTVNSIEFNPVSAADSYGLGIDGFGNVWNSRWHNGNITKIAPNGTPTHISFLPVNAGDRGVTVTPADNHVWVARSEFDNDPPSEPDPDRVTRLNNSGVVVANITVGNEPTGLSVDAQGKVWVICRGPDADNASGPNVFRIDPATNPPTINTPGVDPPTSGINLGLNARPYNYSDMTGMQALSALKYGMWTAVHDSGVAGARWSRVTWNDEDCYSALGEQYPLPPGTSIRVQLRAAETEAGLTREDFVEVLNGAPLFDAVIGQWVQVRAILNGRSTPGDYDTPVLCDLTVWSEDAVGADCNGNDIPDSCEFADCNANCIPDDQDIASGLSKDRNGDGMPDECEPVIFVKASATGDNNGTSWADAFTDLEDALVQVTMAAGRPRIWVAEGTYWPSEQTIPGDPRSSTFRLRCGVGLYGGFAGTEHPATFDIDQRNLKDNPTILSGDLGQNDGPGAFEDYYDNAFHVVTARGNDTTTVLDGFIIEGGNADYNQGHLEGGGMLICDASPTIRNCVFRANRAETLEYSGRGGGVSVQQGASTSLVNCLFAGNQARYGGGIDVRHSEASLINCTLSGNEATVKGGAVEASYDPQGSQPRSSSAFLRNCVLWGNDAFPGANGPEIANSDDSGSNQQDTTINVDDSDIFGGADQVDLSGGGTLTWGADNLDPPEDPVFVGDFRLDPAASPCINAGENSEIPAGVLTDLDGLPRIQDGCVDMGAYEVFPDCNADEVPDPALLSAVSRKNNVSGPGGVCETTLLSDAYRSEPHEGGISQIVFTFDGTALGCLPSIEQATCAAPQFIVYSGAAPTCTPAGNELTCTFSPALENGQTYRFTLGGKRVVLRGLIGDVDHNGFVNAVDRSFVVGAWTSPTHFSCPTDIDNNGTTNAVDRSLVVGAWTGLQSCAPNPSLSCQSGESMFAGGGSGDSPLGAEEASGGATGEIESGRWTPLESSVVVEVRPVGGGTPVTALVPGVAHEVHYSGGGYPVQGYSLSVSGTCDVECSIAPVSFGTWSNTGLFQGLPLDGGRLVLDDLAVAVTSVVPEDGLCTITADSGGELTLELRTYFFDSDAGTVYEMIGQTTVIVNTP